MTDTYTSTVRLQQPTVGADNNTWGGITNIDWQLIDDATNGSVQIDLTGLTSYTMTVNNGTSDQSRNKLYTFTGTLSSTCTVTIPNTVKHGFVRNATTGGHNVVITCGVGPTLTVPPSIYNLMTTLYCDGSTGVYDMMFGNAGVTSQGYQMLPGGLTLQWGSGGTSGSGACTIVFPQNFANACFSVNLTVGAWDGSSGLALILATGIINTNGFTVGSFDSTTGAIVGPVGFTWMAVGN